MAERVFTKDTMLDLVVNIIPLGILAFFIGLFVLWGPYSWDPLYSTLMLGIIAVAGILLTVLTYFSAIAIEGDANEREAAKRAAEEAAAAEATSATADDADAPAGADATDDPATDAADDGTEHAESEAEV
jgi:hypothetical protein